LIEGAPRWRLPLIVPDSPTECFKCRQSGKAVSRPAARRIDIKLGALFDFLLLFHLLNFTPLLLDFTLLRVQLTLGLLSLHLLILHCVAKKEAATRTQRAANRCSSPRCADGSTDYCARSGPSHGADAGRLLTSSERLPGTAEGRRQHYQCDQQS
jgi:hypothetical protein